MGNLFQISPVILALTEISSLKWNRPLAAFCWFLNIQEFQNSYFQTILITVMCPILQAILILFSKKITIKVTFCVKGDGDRVNLRKRQKLFRTMHNLIAIPLFYFLSISKLSTFCQCGCPFPFIHSSKRKPTILFGRKVLSMKNCYSISIF